MKYCMDCGNYIPGGGERNCSFSSSSKRFCERSVSALKEACSHFVEKKTDEDISNYPKIVFKKLKRRKK